MYAIISYLFTGNNSDFFNTFCIFSSEVGLVETLQMNVISRSRFFDGQTV